MTRPVQIDLTLAAVPDTIGSANYDRDHFLSNATGDTWTLTNTVTTDSIAHQVSIANDSATDHSAKTATLIGTDEDGKLITETINLPAASPAVVNTTLYFKTLTSIVPSATIGADTMDIGIKDTASSQTVPTNHHRAYKGIFIKVTGTIDYTVQLTASKIEESTRPFSWINSESLLNKTASAGGEDGSSTTANRLIINSYDTGATVVYQVSQGN